MRQDYQFKLIQGDFTAERARKVLIQMINHKIDFHNVESFSNQERNEGDVDHAKKRVAELEQVRKDLHTTLEEAEKLGMNLEITGTIEIKMTK